MFSKTATMSDRPGYLLNWYPENSGQRPELVKRLFNNMTCLLRSEGQRFKSFGNSLRKIHSHADKFSSASPQQQQRAINQLRVELRDNGLTDALLLRAFGFVKTGVREVFDFEPHDEQLFCAWSLMKGSLTEMATGEGKTVTAALAAVVAALAGIPVHVVTTNDYLV